MEHVIIFLNHFQEVRRVRIDFDMPYINRFLNFFPIFIFTDIMLLEIKIIDNQLVRQVLDRFFYSFKAKIRTGIDTFFLNFCNQLFQ